MKKIFFGLLALAVIFASCSNSSDTPAAVLAATDGGGTNPGTTEAPTNSVTETSEGIKITFSLPANCPIVSFRRCREDDPSGDYPTFFYKTNSTGNTVSAIDCFAQAGITYLYKAEFLNSNWEVKSYSEEVKITATTTGKTTPRLTNDPAITYNEVSKTFTFSEPPTFAMPSLTGFENRKYEIGYKCETDNKWDMICSFSFGSTETNAIYDYFLSAHSGHTVSYTRMYVKLVNENESEWYQFPTRGNCSAPQITLP